MLDFIMNNYIWFIVIGVVLVMALIGYIADKTDFGRNKVEKAPKEKKVKKQKEEIKPEKIEVDAKGINELTKEASKKDSIVPQEVTNEITAQPIDEEKVEEPKQGISNEDLYAPLENSTEVNDNTIDPALYQPLTNTTDVNTVEKENNDTQEEVTNIPEKKDNIETDDDVWKF